MTLKGTAAIVVLLISLTGCATWSTANVDLTTNESSATLIEKDPDMVEVYETDVAERRYESLGDISVTVNKTTVFHPDPTREMVTRKLQERAAKLGADAIIFATYGRVAVSLMSWGSMEGRGRAIHYLD